MVAGDIIASETDEQISNHPPGPPVEVFTTMVSNVLDWSVAETLIEAGTMSYFDVEKGYLKGGAAAATSGSNEFVISTGVLDLRFCSLFD